MPFSNKGQTCRKAGAESRGSRPFQKGRDSRVAEGDLVKVTKSSPT